LTFGAVSELLRPNHFIDAGDNDGEPRVLDS